ncbi:acyltransferase family protein [Hymenobacter arcticus]
MGKETAMPLPATNPQPRKFNLNLEALRGVASIVVVWHHLVLYPYLLDPHYKPSGVFSFVAPGHLSVLIFFVLSGYVIGRAHSEPLKINDISGYLKKRFVRIYPIYILCIIFALLIAIHSYNSLTIISNLTLTQNMLAPVIFENNPAWSLNYEVIFYLLFIPISFLRLNIIATSVIVLIIGVTAYFSGFYLVSDYFLGFTFWLVGLILARYCQSPDSTSFPVMVSMLLLLVSLEKLNVLTTIISKAIISIAPYKLSFPDEQIKFLDLSYLPFCIVTVLVFASHRISFKKHILRLIIFSPALTFYHFLRNSGERYTVDLLIPTLFYVAAVLVFLFQNKLQDICALLIKRLSNTGTISYGLYIIHFPIIVIFSYVVLFSGNPLTFGIRLIAYLIICTGAAYLLEKIFQPWIRRLLS